MLLIFYLFYLVVFAFGASVGSFLNSVIYRIDSGESFLFSRSYCPKCRHKLAWYDLIPIFSFIFLKGKCRYCHKKISLQYPMVEAATGLIFLLIFYLQFPFFPFFARFSLFSFQFLNLIYCLTISSLLIIVFVYDFKKYIILDSIIYSAIAISGIWYFVLAVFFHAFGKFDLLNVVCSAFGAFLFFFFLWFVSKGRWMGFGDVKLAFFMGMFLGSPKIFVALFSSFFLGAIIGLGLIIIGRKTLKSEIPFGPFLVTGLFIAMFFGKEIIDFYFKILSI